MFVYRVTKNNEYLPILFVDELSYKKSDLLVRCKENLTYLG